MSRWRKDATEFTVSVIKNVACRTNYSYIPKPVLDMMGAPKRITFAIRDGLVVVEPGR